MLSGSPVNESSQAYTDAPRCDWFIVADDLTGACDAAAPFAAAGASVTVELSRNPLSQREDRVHVRAVNTRTRDMYPAAAVAAVRETLSCLPEGVQVFKKVDSVFRGNTLAEIAASVAALPGHLVVVAPAYPALGRTVASGMLHIRDVAGNSATIDIAEGLAVAGVSFAAVDPECGTELIEEAAMTPNRVLLCDARSQQQLRTLVRAVGVLGSETLWVGSGGLAHALAESAMHEPRGPRASRVHGRVLFVIGSDHAVMSAQLSALEAATSLSRIGCGVPLPGGTEPVLLSMNPRSTSEAQILGSFARLNPVTLGCIVLSGGDTAEQVLRILGVESLAVQDEFAPGVPVAEARGGLIDGVTLVFKSGGFGERELLCQIIERFQHKESLCH